MNGTIVTYVATHVEEALFMSGNDVEYIMKGETFWTQLQGAVSRRHSSHESRVPRRILSNT